MQFRSLIRECVLKPSSKAVFQIMTKASAPPVAKQSPALLKATARMGPSWPKRVHPCRPVFRSQILILPSWETEVRWKPYGWKAILLIYPSWALQCWISLSDRVSQILIVPSADAPATLVPSGENLQESTLSLFSEQLWRTSVRSRSQSLRVRSSEQLRRMRWSGETSHSRTQLVWREKERTNLPSSVHILSVLSQEQLIRKSSFRATDSLRMGPECAFIEKHLPCTEFFQNRISLSSPADIIVLPSLEKATSSTRPLCPMNLQGRSCGLKFQTCTTASKPPETICFISESKQTELTDLLWPRKERTSPGSSAVAMVRIPRSCITIIGPSTQGELMMDSAVVGAVRVKDGLYLGDRFAAKDLEFALLNKVTRLVNCMQRELPSHWEFFGITYLKLDWQDEARPPFNVEEFSSQLLKYMDEALRQGEGVLILSLAIDSRCIFCLLVYLMRKYRWPFKKAHDFVQSKSIGVDLSLPLQDLLIRLESALARIGLGALSIRWDSCPTANETDEQTLVNTYLNQTQLSYVAPPKKPVATKHVRWKDEVDNRPLASFIQDQGIRIRRNKSAIGKSIIKSQGLRLNLDVRLGSAKPAERPKVDKGLPYRNKLKRNAKGSSSSSQEIIVLSRLANKKLKEALGEQVQEQRLPLMSQEGGLRRVSKRGLAKLKEEEGQLSRRMVNNFTGTLRIEKLKERRGQSPQMQKTK